MTTMYLGNIAKQLNLIPQFDVEQGTTLIDKHKVLESIYAAIDEVNAISTEDKHLDKSATTVLFGEDGRLDSLGLVSLIVEVEGQIETDFDSSVSLADERAMSRRTSPFRNVDSLASYIVELLDE